MKNAFPYALAGLLAVALSSPLHAGTVVLQDSGTGYDNVTGTTTGGTVTSLASPVAVIDIVNGVSLAAPLPTLSTTETITAFTHSGQFDLITGGSGTKTITDGTNSVTLTFSITSGVAFGNSVSTSGIITNVTGSSNVDGFDFHSLLGGMNSMTITNSAVNFANIIGHGGATANKNTLGVSEVAAVPEPTSLALLGIGMTGFLAFRRLFKRPSVA